ncbi:MAG: DUF554 domain-containing protein [Firmicutes bacterium]|nr:DUF554 domain-containing protein [Bacillota bacterium]MDY3091376.1 DUF554 domain-containing protein [Erysipelotrichaceae bacterium]
MAIFGSLVNALGIVIGSILGTYVLKIKNESLKDTMEKGMGLCCILIAIDGMICEFNTLNVLISMAIGTIIGEKIDLEGRMYKLAASLEKIFKDRNIGKAFSSASLIFCVGGMAVIGALDGGLMNSHDTLILKGIIDGILALFMASSLGIGVIFSAGLVFIYEGAIALLASPLSSVLSLGSEMVINNLSVTGSLILLGVGLNIVKIGKFKSMNYVPAIFVSIILTAIIS